MTTTERTIRRLSRMLDAAVADYNKDPATAARTANDALGLADRLLDEASLSPSDRTTIGTERIAALRILAQHYHFNGEPDAARHAGKTALREARALGDDRTLAKCLLSCGSHEMLIGDLDLAEAYLTEARDTFDRTGHDEGVAMTTYNLGMLYGRRDDLMQSLEAYNEALNIARNSGLSTIEAGCYTSLGTVYEQRAEYERAVELHRKAAARARDLGDRFMEGNAIANAATALYNAGYAEESTTMIEQALAIHRSLGNRYGEGTLLNNQAGRLLFAGRPADALVMYEEALRICQQSGHIREAIVARCGRGTSLLRLGRTAQAVEECALGLTEARVLDDTRLVLHSCTAHIEALLASDGAAQARTLFDEAYAREATSDSRSYTVALLDLGTRVYEALKQYRKALALQRERYEAFERQHREDASRRMELHAVELRLAVAERDREILRLQNERLRAEVDRKLQELTSMTLQIAELQQGRKTSRDETKSASWTMFQDKFNTLNNRFTERLALRCPDLTPMELRICSMLKLGLATKDMSSLLHVTERAIEKHRYNIRRKLGLDPKVNIVTFLERAVVER